VTNASQLGGWDWTMFNLKAGTINATRSSFSAGNSSAILAPVSGTGKTVTATFKRCKFTMPQERTVNTRPGTTLNATFTNCIFAGHAWVNFNAEGDTANTITANYCLFLDSYGAVTFGTSADTFTINNSIIDASSAGLNQGGGAMVLNEDYNLINKAGYLLGSHDLDGRNTVIDPMYVNAGAGDYRLQTDSPLLGKAGDLSVTEDYRGNVRPMPAGSMPDIGPYENFLVPVEVSAFSVE